ncbi:MAG: 4Fe-4S binding protein [Candidatus Aureabacteria bacterium]|nr:4Fe-4S binding protein [Candidatus Auribacterota bacterium]
MAKRSIIKIDEDKCNGCSLCIPNCPEGALQIIDGKARLVSDLFCDGLGACIGHCPEGAITIEEREAEKYDERKVMENVVKHGENTIIAHLKHLKDHNEMGFYKEAVDFLKEKGLNIPIEKKEAPESHASHHGAGGCPGAKMMDLSEKVEEKETDESGKRASQLTHWPVQMHLISPMAPYFQASDLVLAADGVAYALADFHKDYLKGKTLAIACPKLDSNQEVYTEKLKALIDEAKINTLTVMIMEVPCCGGLIATTLEAAKEAKRKVPIKLIVVGIKGDIKKEEWVSV